MGQKTRIYAPRLRGDIDLGLEPSRIDGFGAKHWARMTFPGRQLPGRADQHIYETSSTQKFAIGTRRIEYGRTFRYARAGETTTHASHARLLGNGNYSGDNHGKINEDDYHGDLVAAVDAGQDYLDIEQKTMDERAANYYQGGYVTIFNANYNTYYCVASRASTGPETSDSVRIYLDHKTVQSIRDTDGIEIHRSPYSNIIDGPSDSSHKSFVGRALCGEITLNHFFWLQTAGPCFVAGKGPTSLDDYPGFSSDQRDVYAWIDGEIVASPGADPSSGYQRVGYVLPATTFDVDYESGSSFIMLQLE